MAIKIRWRTSLRGRLTALTLGVTIGTLTLSSIGMFVAEYISLRGQKAIDTGIIAGTIAGNLSAAVAFKDEVAATETLSTLRSVPTISDAWLLLPNSVAFAKFSRDHDAIADDFDPAKVAAEVDSEQSVEMHSSYIAVAHPVILDREVLGTVIIRASNADIKQRLLAFAGFASIITALASVLAYLLTIRFQSPISTPILKLAEIARQITASKNYSARAPKESEDEVGLLVSSFNEMLGEIESRDSRLNEARELLEQRVQQRTEELRNEMTVRKQAQEGLQREQEQLRALIKNAPVAIAMLDKKLNYLAHSDQWLAEFEIGRPSLIADNHLASLPSMPQKWRGVYEQVLAGASHTELEDTFVLPSGAKRTLRWTAQPWYRPNGSLGGLVKVVIGIDQLIEAREAALRAVKTRTEFLANVSHELRTPLNGIVGFTKLLMDAATDATDRSVYIETISHSAHLLTNLINDVLDFSKIESKKIRFELVDFEPRRLIDLSVELCASQAQIKQLPITLSVDLTVPLRLCGDPTRVQQILVNLVGNAVKFTEHGSVGVEVTCRDSSGSLVELVITVKDSGIGIPANRLTAVFDPFTQADGSITRQYGGSGLGLTIVRELVNAMGGKISVSSVVGVGSTFTVILPFARSHEQPAEAPAERLATASPTPLQGLRILVAEDNKVNQKLITAILKRNGHTVTVVENGQAAVDAVHAAQFHVVLMDLQMPVMGGVDAAKAIRSAERELNSGRVPIVAVTAHAFEEDRLSCQAAEMDDYLTKPIDTKKLFHTLARVTSTKT